ncbi:MAG TPA: hypothetical protein VNT99_17455 [Methylomirabilota bacterium]|nr:hypothetical protein [Methylomirabilota bacterium]
MHVPLNLTGFFWITVGTASVASVTLLIGISLLLGSIPHRKVALPLVWISASILTAAVFAIVLILTHR